jgi:hypothetical protein
MMERRRRMRADELASPILPNVIADNLSWPCWTR